MRVTNHERTDCIEKGRNFVDHRFGYYDHCRQFTTFAAQCDDVRSSVLRLHILANSDSEEDQALKLKVRDRILTDIGDIFLAPSDLSTAEQTAADSLDEILAVAEDEIRKNGYDYPVQAEIVKMYFTTRQYDDITMPAGYVRCSALTIGKAEGKNWWCVLYPPMCIPAAQPKQTLEDVLEDSSVELVEKNPKYEVRFAVVEWFESIKQMFS